MGYVGNQDTEGFSSIPAKQDLTGATGTSLTLTHPVSSAESIDLFINNVRQEPTTAYSVSGTTVTLTGSVVDTDDIYVVYNGLALQTTVPPDGSVTSAKLVYPLTTFSSTGIDDNAASTAMTLDSSGNVGIGTTSPSTFSPSSTYANVQSIVQADQALTIGSYYQAGVDAYSFIKSSQVGSPTTAIDLRFFGGTSERMRIDSSGRLLVGTSSTSSPFDAGKIVINTSGDGMRIRSGGTPMRFIASGTSTFVGSITTTASSTAYNTSSDYRLKENVTDITGATDRLKQLNPVRFNFIADADTTVDGFLAHEVQDVVPEAITGTKDAVDDDGNPVYQGIDQSKLVPLLVATIQELEARIAALESA